MIWGLSVGAGMLVLVAYANEPGAAATVPESMKEVSGAGRLLVFIHPRCPCTRASLRELARLLANSSSEVTPEFVFFLPPGEATEWAKTDLWESAGRFPGAVRILDGGEWRRRFGVTTSGHVLYYGPSGSLLFSGGVTPGRGHEGAGESYGELSRVLSGQSGDGVPRLVFGCSLEAAEGCLER